MAIELPRIPYKRKGNRRFNYVPKYYNEEKERLRSQIAFHQDKNKNPSKDIHQIKRNIRNSFGYQNAEKSRYNLDEKGRKLSILAIAVILCLILYLATEGSLLSKLFDIFYPQA